jgi:Protein of unknown function (DUF5672)
MRLDEVTLCCVDTRHVDLALAALRRCMAQLDFASVLFFTRRALLSRPIDGIEVVDAEVPSVQAYSEFMLRGLARHVQTSHVLVVQWDGFVRDASRWDPQFLEFDYIGAPWHDQPVNRAVGNGGFSLRSRKLLHAQLDPAFKVTHPEDRAICHVNRRLLETQHGIRVAPRELAASFSYERGLPSGSTFGFHGLSNFARELTAPELKAFLIDMPDKLAASLDAHDLCEMLIARGQFELAQSLLDKRQRQGMHDRRTLRLRMTLWWRRRIAARSADHIS